MEVLDKVGGVLLLPNSELATIQQVAEFFNSPLSTIESVVFEHREELALDGYRVFKKDEVLGFLSMSDQRLKVGRGKTVATLEDGSELIVPSRGLRLFSKRAILRVGMLLRDSEVATGKEKPP